jgi:CheY-like chemotaxis protein
MCILCCFLNAPCKDIKDGNINDCICHQLVGQVKYYLFLTLPMTISPSPYSRKEDNVSKGSTKGNDAEVIGSKWADNKSNKPKIIVVDDDFDICNIMKLALQKQGYNVFGFTDPLLALEHIRTNWDSCDLVISDLRMPAMNGLEFLKNITKMNPTTKLLLMSSFNVEEDQEYSKLFQEIKISGFIQKPVSMRRFGQIIKSSIFQK